MRLVSIDLEINKQVDNMEDWKAGRPLGISCASIAWRDDEIGDRGIKTWYSPNTNPLSASDAQSIVNYLTAMWHEGYTIVGLNSCNFDLDILAEESGLYKECSELAQHHVDLMLMVVAFRGHRLGLDKMAKGLGVGSKFKLTIANSGIAIDMNGAMAPVMWQNGEFDTVLDYQEQDAILTLSVARAIAKRKQIRWIAGSGKENVIDVPGLMTVTDCLAHREDFPAWKTDPDRVSNYTGWILEHIETEADDLPW